MSKKNRKYGYTADELYNPQPDLSYDACLYGRLSTKEQFVEHVESHKAQTIYLLRYGKEVLGYKEDGTTGRVILFVENQLGEDEEIKNASGTWPIDRRPGLKTILDLVDEGKVRLIVAEFVDRLFRDEDRIDSNLFIKICKENRCYVHITSKRMTYNFANPQHAELFRMEVQMAAAYIENHIRGTMLRRRNQKREQGYWVGAGMIPVNFIVDKRDGSPTCGKFVPYRPHAEISEQLYDRFIELGFDLSALCQELGKRPFIYPGFDSLVYKDYQVRTSLKPAPGGGYTISRSCLEYMLCNIVNIGAFKACHEGKEFIIWNNHEPIIDEGRFWMVYDHLQDKRPDGTPTGRKKLVRYTQKETERKRPDLRKPLLKPVTGMEDCVVHFQQNAKDAWYRLGARRGLTVYYFLYIRADELEKAIVKRLFERIRETDLEDLKNRQAQRYQHYQKRLRQITNELAVIDQETETLGANMGKVAAPIVIQQLEARMERILTRKQELIDEQQNTKVSLGEINEQTIAEELEHLEEIWDKKSHEFRKSMLDTLIKTVTIDQVAPNFYRLCIDWEYKEWGVEETFKMQRDNGRKQWSEKELDILKMLSPTTNKREILLQALPTRSWAAIKLRSYQLGLHKRYRRSEGRIIDERLSWNDIGWLDGKGWDIGMFVNSNGVGWTS